MLGHIHKMQALLCQTCQSALHTSPLQAPGVVLSTLNAVVIHNEAGPQANSLLSPPAAELRHPPAELPAWLSHMPPVLRSRGLPEQHSAQRPNKGASLLLHAAKHHCSTSHSAQHAAGVDMIPGGLSAPSSTFLQPQRVSHKALVQAQPWAPLAAACSHLSLRQQQLPQPGCCLYSTTSSNSASPSSSTSVSNDTSTFGDTCTSTSTTRWYSTSTSSALHSSDTRSSSPAAGADRANPGRNLLDDELDEGEVLLDEDEIDTDGAGVPDSEWTNDGSVSTSSHVEDSADEYEVEFDVEFDEGFEFSDEEGLQDNLPPDAGAGGGAGKSL